MGSRYVIRGIPMELTWSGATEPVVARARRAAKVSVSDPTFQQVCDMWARHDHWSVAEAIRLSLAVQPRLTLPKIRDPTLQARIKHRVELALNCVGVTLEIFNPKHHPMRFAFGPANSQRGAETSSFQCLRKSHAR